MKKERPILFSAPMVRAILDGRKTQTRRVVKPQPKVVHAIHSDASLTTNCIFRSGDQRIHCPYGQPSDRLWVRETFYTWDGVGSFAKFKTGRVWYRADGLKTFKWKPSIFMPRWASRITLEIVSVRVERLQDISESDAKSEGVDEEKYAVHYYCDEGGPDDPEDFGVHRCNWRFGFKMLWDSINAKTQPWASNPWVWVLEFNKLNRI